MPQGLTGLQFYNQRKRGEGTKKSLSSLSKRHAPIISSSFRLGRGVFLSLHGRAGSTDCCFFMWRRARPDLVSSLGRMWVSRHKFYSLGACLVLLLPAFAAKQVCLVLWLSNPTFLSNC